MRVLKTLLFLNIFATMSRISFGKTPVWKTELLSLIKEQNASYLCYYLSAKLSAKRKQTFSERNKQLANILQDCGFGNTTLAEPSFSVIKGSEDYRNGHIIMYTHNGFGNQLYQIAFGYLLSRSMGRFLHIGMF